MTAGTVLNVDDLEPQRYVKTRDLRAQGFTVIEATTGAEALRLVERTSRKSCFSTCSCPIFTATTSAATSNRSGPRSWC